MSLLPFTNDPTDTVMQARLASADSSISNTFVQAPMGETQSSEDTEDPFADIDEALARYQSTQHLINGRFDARFAFDNAPLPYYPEGDFMKYSNRSNVYPSNSFSALPPSLASGAQHLSTDAPNPQNYYDAAAGVSSTQPQFRHPVKDATFPRSQPVEHIDTEQETEISFNDLTEKSTSSLVSGTRRNLNRLSKVLSDQGLQPSTLVFVRPHLVQCEAGECGTFAEVFDEAITHFRPYIAGLPHTRELLNVVATSSIPQGYDIDHPGFVKLTSRMLRIASRYTQSAVSFDVGYISKTRNGHRFDIYSASPGEEATHLILLYNDDIYDNSTGKRLSERWRSFQAPKWVAPSAATTKSITQTGGANAFSADVSSEPPPKLQAGPLRSADLAAPSVAAEVSARTKKANTRQRPKKTARKDGNMPTDTHGYDGAEYDHIANGDLLNGGIHSSKIFGDLAGRIAMTCGSNKEIQAKINHLRVTNESQEPLSGNFFCKRLKLWWERKATDSNGQFTWQQFRDGFLARRYGRPVIPSRVDNKGQNKPGANLSARTVAKRKRASAVEDEDASGEQSEGESPRKKGKAKMV